MSDPASGGLAHQTPWLSIIGLGEDGLDGLCSASRQALEAAEIVFGGARHLTLCAVGVRGRAWPVPFSVQPVLASRGRRVAVLTSGDPFWFGAGGALIQHLLAGEWTAFAGTSTFSLAAARLGWRLEATACHGLHAQPFETLRRDLAAGRNLICLVRDALSPAALARWLASQGFGASRMHVLECLGGPRERLRQTDATAFSIEGIAAPVTVAIELRGGPGLPCTSGLPDGAFQHDGQITKQPVRALTLSALAPRRGERLWDIGAGSGSISVEWCLASNGSAIAIEARTERSAAIRINAAAFGLAAQITVLDGKAPDVLTGLPAPNAVFIGGGADAALVEAVWAAMPEGSRLVVNAVTLETEALLLELARTKGGSLLRIDLAMAAPLGQLRGWLPARPLLQWSVVR